MISNVSNQMFIDKFKPIFVFDKEERYYPCGTEFLINNSQLYMNENLVKNFKEVTPQILSENIGNRLKIHHCARGGDINNAPVYYFTRESDRFIDIIYLLIFAYNGPYNILGKNVGEHDSDIENVVIRIDKHTENMVSMYFSAHGDEGVWVKKKDIKFIDNSPIVFVARDSHAMYHTEGRQYRMFGLANDITSFGYSWLNSNLVELTDENPIWMKYTGKLAYDGIDSVINKGWWKEQPVKNSNFFTRFFGCMHSTMAIVEFEDETVMKKN